MTVGDLKKRLDQYNDDDMILITRDGVGWSNIDHIERVDEKGTGYMMVYEEMCYGGN
jgi:hypothetical protein